MRIFKKFREARLYAGAASYLTRKTVTLISENETWKTEVELLEPRIRNEICVQAVLRVALDVRQVFPAPNWLPEARELTAAWWDNNCRTNAQEAVISLTGYLKYKLTDENPNLFYTKKEYQDLRTGVAEIIRSEKEWNEKWSDPNFRQDWKRQEELGYHWTGEQWDFDG